jgi:hypothetical protein
VAVYDLLRNTDTKKARETCARPHPNNITIKIAIFVSTNIYNLKTFVPKSKNSMAVAL